VSGVPPLSAVERRWLILAGTLYAVIVVVLRLSHGGDIVNELALSERLVRGEPLYSAANQPPHWTLWPPFAAAALLPFMLVARASLPVAMALWSVLGVACLVTAAILARRWSWRAVILALAATAMPIQTNFEHRNVNTILLLLIVAAVVDLDDGRDGRAGVWTGLAAALKGFPGLFLVYFAWRRRWRALGVGAGVAVAATALPLAARGPSAAVADARDFLALTLDPARWHLATNDQSIRALVTRFGWPAILALVLTLACLAAIPVVARRQGGRRTLPGMATTALAAILVAPVTWVHYFVLAFPAWLALLSRPDTYRASAVRRAAVWLAAVATSGWLTIGQSPLRRALHEASVYTWGGLLLLIMLATMRAPAPETR
jgi:alpha-1,2-mannosyltransferase